MHPVHDCSQDCETIHKEITKKLVLLIRNSRLSELSNTSSTNNSNNVRTCANKNSWFGLDVPLDEEWKQEECVKTFLSSDCAVPRQIILSVFLNNEDGSIGIEDSAGREPIRTGKILLESWHMKFRPKLVGVNGSESNIRMLYKKCVLYVRSLYTILRLLPVYSLLQQQQQHNFKLPLEVSIKENDDTSSEAELNESLIIDSFKNAPFESVQRSELAVLETDHGDLELSVSFRRFSFSNEAKFYTIFRSPAIRVPQQIIKARDIQIKSSPATAAGSGDWVDMGKSFKASLDYDTAKRNSLKSALPKSSASGQVRILTTSHRPASLKRENKTTTNLTEFIKIFEKPDPLILIPSQVPMCELMQVLENERSKKIVFDRWLEELEIEHEARGFDLVSNME